jgi:hypothetical protein
MTTGRNFDEVLRVLDSGRDATASRVTARTEPLLIALYCTDFV